jgi:hypothetical protein
MSNYTKTKHVIVSTFLSIAIGIIYLFVFKPANSVGIIQGVENSSPSAIYYSYNYEQCMYITLIALVAFLILYRPIKHVINSKTK